MNQKGPAYNWKYVTIKRAQNGRFSKRTFSKRTKTNRRTPPQATQIAFHLKSQRGRRESLNVELPRTRADRKPCVCTRLWLKAFPQKFIGKFGTLALFCTYVVWKQVCLALLPRSCWISVALFDGAWTPKTCTVPALCINRIVCLFLPYCYVSQYRTKHSVYIFVLQGPETTSDACIFC